MATPYDTDATEEVFAASEGRTTAPYFVPPQPLEYDFEEREKIADYVFDTYRSGVDARHSWNSDHLVYDQMHRGQVDKFNPRAGPWPDSANLHVQAPYWLIEALNVRVMLAVWNQQPLVVGKWEDDADREVAKKAAHRIEWHLQPARMNARAMWSRASKIRFAHGVAVASIHYAHTKYRIREYIQDPDTIPPITQTNTDGTPQLDEVGNVITTAPPAEDITLMVEKTKYRGPVIYPLEFQDVIATAGAMNLQPNSPSNPGGSDQVIVRQFEHLYLMAEKAEGDNPAYPYLMDDDRDMSWWRSHAPAQDLSGGTENNTGAEQQKDRFEGTNRIHQNTYSSDDDNTNPMFEILTGYCRYPVQDPLTKEYYDEEVVFFVSKEPRVFLGGFLLSDIVWSGKRPLVELHYQTISNRFYSMGVCELCRSLSEELDTIHNMRIDVGFITNMPFFFYTSHSDFQPNEVTIAPLQGIPVSDTTKISFPSFNNVTSFYHQEETLLLSYIERVFGITDLNLGVSPQHGAAARTATGFMGTQQEGNARVYEIVVQDTESFSHMCNLIYELDIQYGPPERSWRLGDVSYEGLTRDDLWFRKTYDFRVGANLGTFSQQIQMQRAQAVLQVAAMSPLSNQSLGRRWEAEAMNYRAMGLTDPEIHAIIGPKEAIGEGEPKSQQEENEAMARFVYGAEAPAPVHPSDDDRSHIQGVQQFLGSDIYEALGRPNEQSFINHLIMHNQSMATKRQQAQMAQMQQQQQQQQGGGQMPGAGGASTENRAAAQMGGAGAGGGGGGSAADIYALQTQAQGQPRGNGNMPLPDFLGGGQ